MAKLRDYYQILEVDPDATQDQIKSKYHTLALKYHPDRGGDSEKMSEVNEAYSILSDPNLKANYDEIYERFHNTSSHHTEEYIDHTNDLINLLVVAKKEARKAALQGLIYLVIGAAVTIGGYMLAPAGGQYLVAWGAILFGGYGFARGLHYYFNPHLLVKKSMGITAYKQYYGGMNLKRSYWGIIISAILLLVVLGAIGSVTGSHTNATNNSGATTIDGGSSDSGTADLTSDQQNLKDQADAARDTYNTCASDLSDLKSQIDQVNNQLDSFDAEGNTYAYNNLIPQQNSLVDSYNSKRTECTNDQTAANTAIDSYNQSIGQ